MEIEAPVIVRNPKVEIDPALLAELQAKVHEAGQVVVHCIQSSMEPTYIRIWPTTFLFDHHSDHVSTLVHAENITYFPVWKAVGGGDTHFTLVFSGFPKTVRVFDLLEQCQNQAGAFKIFNISRNNSDVYYVKV